MTARAGVDTGGTFTDVVFDDGTIAKVPSTPADPAGAVANGLGGRPVDALAHGTTVATNALLERRGGRVALVTTKGFADVIEIGRQTRPRLYDQFADRPEPLVPRALRFEEGDELPTGIESVAVCFLDADRDPTAEAAIAASLRGAGHDVTCSHEVSPEFREYERTVTTIINAYLRPPCRAYLARLAEFADRALVMTSAGGLIAAAEGAERPVALLLSGPAGGVRAAAAAAVAAGFPDAVTFDMGGTSTDVCLVRDGVPEPAGLRTVGGFPVRMPSLDIHTIGAGGGSIASIDPGGALVVGPESAGADPGPACYGRGGRGATVTDADLVAGRIEAEAVFPGLGRLDLDAARAALSQAGVTAEGVIAVVDENMVQAVRAVTVERGFDPRELALVAFGGAGPLHACAIAQALDMPAVVVPPRAGVLSAVGLLAAPEQVDLVRSAGTASVEDLRDEARRLIGRPDAEVVVSFDCRYAGQSHELTVAAVDDFPAEHERRNGYARPDTPVEVVAVRVSARVASPVDMASLPVVGTRSIAVGPTVLSEPDCTVWLPSGWIADVHPSGSWILRRA